MVSIIRRMRKLRAKLLGIRIGPGAAILPPEVTRIHMDFALKREGGHIGPRKFWRNCLPRLKYHNPAIPMTINRTTNQGGPAVMKIHFTNPTTATNNTQTTSAPVSESTPMAPIERIAMINMKHKNESEILTKLLAITKAVSMAPTEEELEQIRDLEEKQRLSEQDSKRSQAVNDKRRRAEAMLAQARGEVAATREA